MPAGRPTKYKAEYCEAVVAHMSEGASLTSFAAEIDVSRSTINEWMSANPEFSEAVKRGKAKCASWWEKNARALALEGGGPGAVTCTIFGLKNMAPEDWRDKHDLNHTSDDKSMSPVDHITIEILSAPED